MREWRERELSGCGVDTKFALLVIKLVLRRSDCFETYSMMCEYNKSGQSNYETQ